MNHYPLIASAGILILTYLAIGLEKIHKAIVALVAAALVLLLKLLTQKEAFAAIDFNVIFLLTGMMIIVHIASRTGLFQWIAIRSAKMVRGQPMLLLIVFCLVTAMLSALLDNVTTVLLVGPVTLLITQTLKIDPVPFVISEALASNIGGTSTLIGDPPNIMIGSAAGLSFLDFLTNLGPVIIVIIGFFAVTLWLVFRRRFRTASDLRNRVMELDETKVIRNRPLLIKSLVVIGLVIGMFLVHDILGYKPGEIALAGAALLLLLKGGNPEDVLKEVDWSTILFFVALFIVVGAAVKAGLINYLAKGLLDVTKGNPIFTALAILWASAFLSAIVDNIPYVATMIPLVQALSGSMDVAPLWWALALGACLGGNGTLVGASANVVLTGLAGKSGFHIHFMRFTKYGFPMMIETLIIAGGYLVLRYYVLS